MQPKMPQTLSLNLGPTIICHRPSKSIGISDGELILVPNYDKMLFSSNLCLF